MERRKRYPVIDGMKKCTKCDNALSITFFFRKGYKIDGSIKYCSQCKDCMRDEHNQNNRLWKLNNPDKHKENVKRQWQILKSNPEKLKRHYENAKKHNEFRVYKPDVAKAKKARYREELHDEYIKQLLLCHTYGLMSAKDITPDLINLKREQLILTRKLKNHE
jgi:hypothetical protein